MDSSPTDASVLPAPPAPPAMQLTPPVEGDIYPSLEKLIRSINTHPGPQEYAVVIARFKPFKKGVKKQSCDAIEAENPMVPAVNNAFLSARD